MAQHSAAANVVGAFCFVLRIFAARTSSATWLNSHPQASLMHTNRYIMLGFITFMAVVAISIFAYRIASPSRTKLEVGGVVPYLSIFGVLGFLVGLGLVVYDREGYLKFGLGLAALGWLAAFASYFIAQKKSRKTP